MVANLFWLKKERKLKKLRRCKNHKREYINYTIYI